MCGCTGNAAPAPAAASVVPGVVVVTESTTAGAGLLAQRTAAAGVSVEGPASFAVASQSAGSSVNSHAWMLVGGLVVGLLAKQHKLL